MNLSPNTQNQHFSQATGAHRSGQWDFRPRTTSKLPMPADWGTPPLFRLGFKSFLFHRVCAFPLARLNSFHSFSANDSLQNIPRGTRSHSATGLATRACRVGLDEH